jgi:hypothetical protein
MRPLRLVTGCVLDSIWAGLALWQFRSMAGIPLLAYILATGSGSRARTRLALGDWLAGAGTVWRLGGTGCGAWLGLEVWAFGLTLSANSSNPTHLVLRSSGMYPFTELGAFPLYEKSRMTRYLSRDPALGTSPIGEVLKGEPSRVCVSAADSGPNIRPRATSSMMLALMTWTSHALRA